MNLDQSYPMYNSLSYYLIFYWSATSPPYQDDKTRGSRMSKLGLKRIGLISGVDSKATPNCDIKIINDMDYWIMKSSGYFFYCAIKLELILFF